MPCWHGGGLVNVQVLSFFNLDTAAIIAMPWALYPWDRDQVFIVQKAGGSQGWSGQTQKISQLAGFKPQTVQPLASCYTNYMQVGQDQLLMGSYYVLYQLQHFEMYMYNGFDSECYSRVVCTSTWYSEGSRFKCWYSDWLSVCVLYFLYHQTDNCIQPKSMPWLLLISYLLMSPLFDTV